MSKKKENRNRNLLNSMVSKYKAIPWLSEQNLGIEMKVSRNLLCQWFALVYRSMTEITEISVWRLVKTDYYFNFKVIKFGL